MQAGPLYQILHHLAIIILAYIAAIRIDRRMNDRHQRFYEYAGAADGEREISRFQKGL